MRIGMQPTESVRKLSEADRDRSPKLLSDAGSGTAASNVGIFQQWLEDEAEKKRELLTVETSDGTPTDRSEAQKICEAALKGGETPLRSIRSAPKVPYGYLARDGVINYNGVQFVCDEKTNSICLGDVTDPKQVINIPLSGGGHLKVNRANLGQLSKAIGMFSPEDVNRILWAIHLDTKLQSMQKEMDDLEADVGEQIAPGSGTSDAEEKTAECP